MFYEMGLAIHQGFEGLHNVGIRRAYRLREQKRSFQKPRTMQDLEFALIVLACVIGSAVLSQMVRRLSLPLVQIAIGCVVVILAPTINEVVIPSELFLVMFIAPLLFNEARNTDPRELWENKGSIISLAVGLVLLMVLVVVLG